MCLLRTVDGGQDSRDYNGVKCSEELDKRGLNEVLK